MVDVEQRGCGLLEIDGDGATGRIGHNLYNPLRFVDPTGTVCAGRTSNGINYGCTADDPDATAGFSSSGTRRSRTTSSANGGIRDSLADFFTGEDAGDLAPLVAAIAADADVDPVLVIAVLFVEQGQSGNIRGGVAALESASDVMNALGLPATDTHGLANSGRELFDNALAEFADELAPHAGGRDPDRLWRSLGEPGNDDLAIAILAYTLKSYEEALGASFVPLPMVQGKYGSNALAPFDALVASARNVGLGNASGVASGMTQYGDQGGAYVAAIQAQYPDALAAGLEVVESKSANAGAISLVVSAMGAEIRNVDDFLHDPSSVRRYIDDADPGSGYVGGFASDAFPSGCFVCVCRIGVGLQPAQAYPPDADFVITAFCGI